MPQSSGHTPLNLEFSQSFIHRVVEYSFYFKFYLPFVVLEVGL